MCYESSLEQTRICFLLHKNVYLILLQQMPSVSFILVNCKTIKNSFFQHKMSEYFKTNFLKNLEKFVLIQCLLVQGGTVHATVPMVYIPTELIEEVWGPKKPPKNISNV